MVIYENIKDIESAIDIDGNMQVIKKYHIEWFNESHALNHSMAIVCKNMLEFYHIMITYSGEQKIDLKYSWKILHWSVKFKTSGKNMTEEHNKCHLRSFLVA